MLEWWVVQKSLFDQSSIPSFHYSNLYYSIFVRLIACQEQVDTICSAKLYALVAATSQLGKSGPVLRMEVPYEQAG
jgi:hypothetical protein